MMLYRFVCAVLLLFVACPRLGWADTPVAPPLVVKVKRKPGDAAWKEYASRSVETLPGFQAKKTPPSTDKWGGRTDRKSRATGFFRVEKQGNRWWMVDPDGGLFVLVGINSVAPSQTPGGITAQKSIWGDTTGGAWAKAETERLHKLHFNGWGGWSAYPDLRESLNRTPYVIGPSDYADTKARPGFVRGFAGTMNLARQGSGHALYPNDCLPVFHAGFEAYCDTYAQAFAVNKNDPALIGYFSDNELPAPVLDKYLALDAADPNMGSTQKAAQNWLDARKHKTGASVADITNADRDDWVEFVYDRYFAVTTRAIRKYDPNHLCLGSRFYGGEKSKPEAFRAAGRYLDIVSVNHYFVWSPTKPALNKWTDWGGKPILLTEWYAKGMDSGFPNNSGAGWVVETQKDRGIFYQTFTLALLEAQNCVGWTWFKYMDNDPDDKNADPSNVDSNKGLVTNRYVLYAPLADAMEQLNRQVYALTDFFDTPSVNEPHTPVVRR